MALSMTDLSGPVVMKMAEKRISMLTSLSTASIV
jgi:hypothetical protein